MSRIDAALEREVVELDGRGAMTAARKERIWRARNGICWMCGLSVDVLGPTVRYDHKLPIDLGGKDDDDNLWPLHREPCDRIKTKADRKRIDKHRRQQKLRLDVERTVSPAWGKARGFAEPRRVPARRSRP